MFQILITSRYTGHYTSKMGFFTNKLQLRLQSGQHVQLRRLERSVHFSTHITKNGDFVSAIVLN